ncbi:hypothetical protein ASE94_01775 [Devosia sp. Leaf64]|nr:hypothetical protein ASE94_01775 [Devosia sp. Leaf64]
MAQACAAVRIDSRLGGLVQDKCYANFTREAAEVRGALVGIALISLFASIVVASVLGFMTLSLFLRIDEICPDFFDCEDARNAAWLFAALMAPAALVTVGSTWVLKKLAKPTQVGR